MKTKLTSSYLFIPIINFVSIFLLIIFFNFINLLQFEQSTKQEILDNAPKYIKAQTTIITSFTKHSHDLIWALASSQNLENYLQTNDTNRLSDLFHTTIQAETYLMQIRFIDKAGMETIRFDRKVRDGDVVKIEDKDLQDKSNRDYVKENLHKPKRIWVSDLDLNIEKGKVENPFKPTFRVIVPVWNKDDFRGMIVFNYFAEAMLENLFQSHFYQARLIDQDGYILYSNNKKEAWSRFQNNPFKVLSDNESIIEPINTPFHNNLSIQIKLNQDGIQQKLSIEKDHVLKVSIFLLLAGGILSFLIYLMMNKLQLQIEDSKNQLNIQTKLLEKEKYLKQLNTLIDKHLNYSVTDLDGIIIQVSEKFCKVCGYKKEELIGYSHNKLRDPEVPKSFYEVLWNTISLQKTWSGEMINLAKNGERYHIKTTIEPLYDENGKHIGYTAVREQK